MENNIVFSGIQPTGEMHIGNYFGAVANYVRLQNAGKYQTIYCVVDLHAMTTPYDPATLRRNSGQMFIDLLACGLDPDRSIVFVQSMVPEHTELAWIFGCVCSYGDLTRQTQFKEKSEQLEGKQDAFISAGLFTYPVLQAADILLYRAANMRWARTKSSTWSFRAPSPTASIASLASISRSHRCSPPRRQRSSRSTTRPRR